MSDQITIIKKDNQVTVIENPNNVSVGLSGIQGPKGSSILSGSGSPTSNKGSVGDYYLDSSADILYGPKIATGWPTTGISIKGTQGPQGIKGDQGYSVLTGIAVPDNSLGKDGDIYIRTQSNYVYTKINGAWTNPQPLISVAAYSYVYEQQSNQTVWNVTHNLGYKPATSIIDYGSNNLEADITFIDVNRLTITFTSPTSGYAYLS